MSGTQWDNLPKLIELNDGFLEWDVSRLLALTEPRSQDRSIERRAGAVIVKGIERELADRHIGHLPPQIPPDRTRRVLLYSQGERGPGIVLHLAQQLATAQATEGASVDVQVRQLAIVLGMYVRIPE
ncbi:hypothetical protein [Streptomyces sp. NPDC051577]|uniref:hypothetical protein n=1 Tax=Streptomyces sp. NPDC051577 TaxID=3155166 RepID=UPI00343AA6D5